VGGSAGGGGRAGMFKETAERAWGAERVGGGGELWCSKGSEELAGGWFRGRRRVGERSGGGPGFGSRGSLLYTPATVLVWPRGCALRK